MRISVVIPTYNEEAMIGPCLAHLQAQTRPANEIIVVDNNCKDGTVGIAAQSGARIIIEAKQGIIHARNAGFNAATGELILRIDADTRVPPAWISEMERLAAAHPNAAAFTGPCTFYDRRFGRIFGFLQRAIFFGVSYFYQGHHTLFGSNMAIRKSAWEKVRDHVCTNGDHVVHEDIDLALHTFEVGGDIVYSDAIFVGISGRRMSHSVRSLFSYVMRWITTMRSHVSSTRSRFRTPQR